MKKKKNQDQIDDQEWRDGHLRTTRGNRTIQFLAMMTGTLSIVSSGMHYGWPSPSLPVLQRQDSPIRVSNEEGSWLAVMPLCGATLGSLTGALVLDVVGRRRGVLLTAPPFFASWLLVAYGRTATVLMLARLVAGVADGLAFCAVPMYLGEIAEPEVRGFIGSSCSITWILGMLLVNALGSQLSIETTALVASLVPLILLLTFFWMPESPYFLAMRGDAEGARRSLRALRRRANVEDELDDLLASTAAAQRRREKDRQAGSVVEWRKFVEVMSVRSNLRALLTIFGLRAVQQLSGTMAITVYATSIFAEASPSAATAPLSAGAAACLYFAVQLVVSGLSSLLVDRTGRRPLLAASTGASGACLLVQAVYLYLVAPRPHPIVDAERYSAVSVGALIAYVVAYSVGLQAIPILMLSELFPLGVKAAALCVADVYFNVLATAVAKFFQMARDAYGMHVPFFFFGACCAVGVVFVVLYVPETRGKTLDQIQRELRGDKVNTRQPADAVSLPATTPTNCHSSSSQIEHLSTHC